MGVEVENPDGSSDVLLVCEHASNEFPEPWVDLGINDDVRRSHVAFDPGALAVARHMSRLLCARLVRGTVSRLIYDCNRPPEAPSAMPERSEIFDIPGNQDLSAAQKQLRVEKIYEPFRAALAHEVSRHRDPVLVTVHSFTPVYFGQKREVEIGILDAHDRRMAEPLFKAMQGSRFTVRSNEPYGPENGVAHTLEEHAIRHGHLNVMLEIRNDLIADVRGQAMMAEWLASKIGEILPRLR